MSLEYRCKGNKSKMQGKKFGVFILRSAFHRRAFCLFGRKKALWGGGIPSVVFDFSESKCARWPIRRWPMGRSNRRRLQI